MSFEEFSSFCAEYESYRANYAKLQERMPIMLFVFVPLISPLAFMLALRKVRSEEKQNETG